MAEATRSLSSVAASVKPVATRSLRTRWNRAFALLAFIVFLSGLAGLVGSHLVAGIFSDSAIRVERQATLSASLRAGIVAQSLLVTEPVTPGWRSKVGAGQAVINANYAEAISDEETVSAKKLLMESRGKWQAIETAVGPLDNPADQATRGAAVSLNAPSILSLLDQAGAASRTAVRVDLADASSTDRQVMAVLASLGLLAILLALRLSHRLSTEVLRPLVTLRDSANQLANGKLDHRVAVDRADALDELGELATSFNAMADAIAGIHRSLTLEASTDSLSGLANRAAFSSRLQAVLTQPNRRSSCQAVLFVDLDDFKEVNDTMGHAAGDELLRVVAARLRDSARPGDLVSRLGGDEFALLLDGLSDPELAVSLAERVVAVVAEPVRIGERWVHVGASVGLAMRRQDSTVGELMRQADVAMYSAKAKGKNRVESYDADMDELAVARQGLKADLEGAVGRGELILHYQPIVELETGVLVGLEALVRWQHPVRGLLPPSAFIELAEETGAIVGVGAHVLETAARQVHLWQRRYGLPEFWLSVNVSVCQLDRPGFAQDVDQILLDTGLDPAHLVLEVTETVLANPEGAAASGLTALRRSGVRVALDDFGTGYSSIGYLRQLPVDILKIDRSFVADTSAAGSGNALLEAIVAMAKSMGLEVIPEGIEEHAQLSRLRAMGCHIGQGFLLSRPEPAEAIEVLLSSSMPLPHVGLSAEPSSAQPASDRALPAILRPSSQPFH